MGDDEPDADRPDRQEPPEQDDPWTPLPSRRVLRGGRRRSRTGEAPADTDASDRGSE